MFGGYGTYHQDIVFGLVADDELCLKADKQSEPLFEENQLTPFEFNKDGKIMQMSYYHAPEQIYHEPEQALVWAEIAYAAALRANAAKLNKKVAAEPSLGLFIKLVPK
ncbi:MAG: DNA transformation protein [Arenicella sp.]|jgi:DNA transformation protein